MWLLTVVLCNFFIHTENISFIQQVWDSCCTHKITVVCLSVFLSGCSSIHQFCIFLRNASLVFPDFLRDGRQLDYLETDRPLFSRKVHFFPNLGKNGAKWPPSKVFPIFWKTSLVFPGNNLKWKLMLKLMFHH